MMLAVAAAAYGAGITLSVRNMPADKVFASLMKETGRNFIYSSDLLRGMKVTLNVKDASLKSVLDDMFRGTDIGYRVKGKNITLFRVERPKAPKRVTVSGFVREAGTGEALAGVSVYAGNGVGVMTNPQGFYSITLPVGEVSLKLNYLGYQSVTTEPIALTASRQLDLTMEPEPAAEMLQEVTVVGTPGKAQALNASEIGAMNVTKASILSTPVIFGESDVIKTLQLEPGVSAGVEGMAGMYVHGGNADENLYMLDNIPLYQVNHFGGLFSAFNTEALRSVDFYKSSFPAKYDGRLASYLDVHTKDGSMQEHHGSVKLGLTSVSANVDGPIWKDHTSYSVAVRRSWYDVLTLPACAILSAISNEEKLSFGYAFTDLNAKINHRFSPRSRAYVMFYYGEDYLRTTQTWDEKDVYCSDLDRMKSNLRWGNIVASAGWNYVLTPKLFGELTGAFTRYSSSLSHSEETGWREGDVVDYSTYDKVTSRNNIHDWILKLDFDWHPHPTHTVSFGAGYTRHSFLPSRTERVLRSGEVNSITTESVRTYHANEMNIYAGGDWRPFDALRVNYGLHYSLFNIEGRTHQGLSPRLSARWKITPDLTVKGGYSRTVQYVHQLIQSSISLPTDQWVPVVGDQKPQTADKVALGAYYSLNNTYTFSVEGYWKWMRNLLEYADEYYLLPPETQWDAKLTPGCGTSKGIDFKVAKETGRFTGHVAYSLLWADRQYADKNHGRPFPARFDNRHKINVMVNWKINKKWEASASWTGMSGNRITLPTQLWYDPGIGPWHYDMLLSTDVNNYRLPFYHRLDLSFRRNTAHGYWTFSLYNAYCNMNTIAVIRDYADNDSYYDEYYTQVLKPVFQKVKLIPIIPSVSYTWIF